MKLISFRKTDSPSYLKTYEMTYENKAGKEKRYEMVSRRTYQTAEELTTSSDGVSIVALKNDKLLLLHEFRMGVNHAIYNLCAGMKEENESIEECIQRELYEETGLKLLKIVELLPPSYAAVAISDVMTNIAIVQVTGEIEDHTSENEEIDAAFYSREETAELLQKELFSSRAQIIAYFFSKGFL